MRWEGLSGIRTQHGMLVFDSRETFNKTLELLAREDTSTEYSKEYNSTSTTTYSTITNDDGTTTTTATVAFGDIIHGVVRVDSTTHDTTVYDPTESVIYDRVLDDFEHHFSFKSLRKDLEYKEIEFLNGGSEGDDPWNYFIPDEYLQTVLNPDMEVQIGDTIVKYIDAEVMILITDGDYSTLDAIRENPLDYIHYPNVIEDSDYGPLIGVDRDIRAVGCQANFSVTLGVGDFACFTDLSTAAITTSISNWVWNFGDGTSSTFQNPTHDYNGSPAGKTVYLTITCYDGCTATYSYLFGNCNADFSFKKGPIKTNFWPITTPFQYTYNLTCAWNFGDPNSGTDNTITGDGLIVSHAFSAPGLYIVSLVVNNNITGCVASTVSKEVLIPSYTATCKEDCEVWGENIYDGGNQKITCKLWVSNNFLQHIVGTRTKHEIKKSGGDGWKEKTADIYHKVWGSFYQPPNCDNEKIVLDDYNNLLTGHASKKDFTETFNKDMIWQTNTSNNRIGIHQNSLNSRGGVLNSNGNYEAYKDLSLWQ